MIDSFWRALAYCLHPKVVLLSLLPLILMAVIVTGLGALYWDLAVSSVRTWMELSPVLGWGSTWLERMGLLNLKAVIAPLVIIVAVTPVVMIMSLLAVSLMVGAATGHGAACTDLGVAHLQGDDIRRFGRARLKTRAH